MKKLKKIIFLSCFVMLIAVMAVVISAAAPESIDLDTSSLTDNSGNAITIDSVVGIDGNPISSKEEGGTVYALPLYDGESALTYYLDGTTLTATLSTNHFQKDSISITNSKDFVIVNLCDSNFDNTTKTPKFESKKKLLYVWLNETTATISEYSFKNTGLIEITIPSSVGEIQQQIFLNSYHLKTVNFDKNEKLKTIGTFAFGGCKALETIDLSNLTALETIGDTVFKDCFGLKNVKLSPNLKTLGTYVFNSSKYGQSLSIDTIIMPVTLTTIEKGAFSSLTNNMVKIFFTGTKDQLDALISSAQTSTGNDRFAKITNIVEYDSDKGYDYYNLLDGAYIIYNYNQCEAFYNGNHTKSDAVLAYADGFDKSGTSTRTCPECGYTYESTTIDPIFTASGYSLGTDTMYAGFTVNTDALSAYNLYAGEGKELKYGIIVSNVNDSSITSVNFDDNKVITNENSIQIEITNYGFSRFGLTLTGFTDATKALNIVMSAYVIGGDGNMSFVQSGTATDTTYVKTIDAIVGETTKATLGAVTFTKISELAA